MEQIEMQEAEIDLYTWVTPNCQKINILVEELGVAANIIPVDIFKGEQRHPEFLAVNPNKKVPVIIDRATGWTVIESGAIMLHLAEKHGRLLPTDPARRSEAIQWLMWQMGGFGPVLAQTIHFHGKADLAAYARDRFWEEARRLYRVLDGGLEGRDFLADGYSIADIAVWPWASRFGLQRIELAEYPNVLRWYRSIAERPAVQAGFKLLQPDKAIPLP